MHLDVLRNQLAELPSFNKSPPPADMKDADVGEPDENTPEELEKLWRILEKHQPAFISSGNALPPPARGIISMDFVIPLPASAQGNTALLLFQDMFSGYVMCKAMKDTAAQAVAEAYEEVVFRQFGASSEIRHDQDPRFMSDVFKAFARMMKSQQRATLAYRPQANGQQERSVQSVVRAIKSYISEPAQEDWEDLAACCAPARLDALEKRFGDLARELEERLKEHEKLLHNSKRLLGALGKAGIPEVSRKRRADDTDEAGPRKI
ncbi:hypothetical protein P43SY_009360 [Pythium insidiosum]|uniref:Integrase catalytic domain-containing protein n=1 Tax=Pythium insidiosum TaxID=114742 RepID=A0AAD5LM40_PYTIN|nr:hypothetical protein P43SY_009360 [Pythium insidiosum]